MTHLTKEGILPRGTVRIKRIPGCVMSDEKTPKKQGKGTIEVKVAIKDNTKVSVVSWYDNKVATIISMYVGSKPTGEKKWYFSTDKIHKMIPCPQSILVYNKYMGE
ncbi:hypothetical protein Zmor_014902 [Zophobas morio]|uniref:PiggyBac transposable element-derived protein domain-containing protein n=1 Tax=Zophobas morio TaxID=2755281 RepID=A0AA38IJ25_9CUCU|nr:hypothetical protein Zmor_014902 [Zophobas morio]